LVVIGNLADAVEAVVTVVGGLAAGIGAGFEVSGGVVIGSGDAGVGAGLFQQVAEAVYVVSCGEVSGIGDTGDLALTVIAGVDLPQGAADDGLMGFQLANRLVQGVELVLPDAP